VPRWDLKKSPKNEKNRFFEKSKKMGKKSQKIMGVKYRFSEWR
jgi:hypothetical protein